MERQIRVLAVGFLVLFGALAAQLNYLQVFAADDLANHPANKRLLIQEYDVDRGDILAADGRTVLARSRATGGDFKYLRRYPEGSLYSHLTGYYSLVFGRSGLEQAYNDFLAARAPELFADRLIDDILGRDRRGASLVLTINPRLQRAAARALGQREGAVAAVDPQSGNVLALVANPSFDPDLLSSHKPKKIRRSWKRLNPEEPDSPLVSRAADTFFPPGSSFKVVTASAALENGMGPGTTLPNPLSYTPPQTTRDIENFGGGLCTGGSQIDMRTAMTQSCNVYFAQLAVKVGAEGLVEQARRFGISENIPFDIPFAEGQIPPVSGFENDTPAVAQSGIGQRDVRMNVLHMALIAGAIGNEGTMMRPRLVQEIRDPDGRILEQFLPEKYGDPLSRGNANILTEMMVSVVQAGTGTAAQIPGVTVAGKTGTAQTIPGNPPHAWFIGFGPAERPRIAAAAVVLKGGGVGSEATGGELAAPIVKAVMEAGLT